MVNRACSTCPLGLFCLMGKGRVRYARTVNNVVYATVFKNLFDAHTYQVNPACPGVKRTHCSGYRNEPDLRYPEGVASFRKWLGCKYAE